MAQMTASAFDIAATFAALALLSLAERHAEKEERDGFAGAAANRWGFAESRPNGISVVIRNGKRTDTQLFMTRRFLENWIPGAAYSLVIAGVAGGLLGQSGAFSFAAAFVIADKLVSHEWLRLPGDTGWWGAVVAAALLVLRFDAWGALAGAGMLAGFLGGLWALGKVRGWAK